MSRYFDRTRNDMLIGELRESYNSNELSLFIGAGVSASAGLPLWSELSLRILSRAFPQKEHGWQQYFHQQAQDYTASKGPLDAMRMARRALGSEFSAAVRQSLYEKPLTPSHTIKAIAKLNRIEYACSYNYDDILEQEVKATGRPCFSIRSGHAWKEADGALRVFHPHGLLSSDPSQGSTQTEIILSEDDYHELYSSPYSRANLIQMKLLMSKTVLFIGCSLLDPNIRRLLDAVNALGCRNRCYAFLRDPAEPIISRERQRGLAPGWHGLSVGPIIDLEYKCLVDRGVFPIWYENHDDIPDLVDQVIAPDGLKQFGLRKGEREVIQGIVSMYAEGLDIDEISRILNDTSCVIPRGLPAPEKWWDRASVIEVLKMNKVPLRPNSWEETWQ